MKVEILIFSLISLNSAIDFPKVNEPYFDITLEKFDLLFQDDKFSDFSKLKVKKQNRTRALVGEYTFKIPFGDEIMMEGKFYKKQGGEYRLLPYRSALKPYCQANIEDG